jgi:hypothetical protein
MRTDRSLVALLAPLAATSLVALSGCPGTLDDPARFLVDAAPVDAGADVVVADAAKEAAPAVDSGDPCGDVPTRVFAPSCGGNGCHGAMGAQQGLDLESPGVAARVVGVSAKECSVTLADPKNPEGSLLYTKLGPNPPCGSQMPIARPVLSATDVACVKAWIAAQQ